MCGPFILQQTTTIHMGLAYTVHRNTNCYKVTAGTVCTTIQHAALHNTTLRLFGIMPSLVVASSLVNLLGSQTTGPACATDSL
jgi:hypothetical protein